ncbi:hypothetical protein [Aquisalimonas sp.]|uniref:hypothetical protein n=1 Tax=Aquisalimonas sp. TaxID=1872621 RepID=UPI0025C08998|nr:hypothetical protein [Aquisalimonas sp.]
MPYRYLFATMIGDRTIAEVPLRDVSYGWGLNGPTDWTAKLPLSAELIRTVDPQAATTPAAVALWIERDGELAYGGPLWARRYRSASGELDLGGSDWLSYFDHRYLSANRNYGGMTSAAIVEDLVDYLASFTGWPGIDLDLSRAVGTPTADADLRYDASELREVGRILSELSDAGGFDYGLETGWTGNRRAKRLALYYPERGRRFTDTRLVLEHPGSIIAYTEPEDGTDVATDLFVLGAGEGSEAIRARRTREQAHTDGYPRLNRSWSYTDLTSQSEVDRLADTAEATYSRPTVDVDLEVDPDAVPHLGAYTPGDEVEYRIEDLRHPRGFAARQRIASIEVSPPQDDSPERVTLKLSGPRTVLPR